MLYIIVLLFIRAPFYVLSVFVAMCSVFWIFWLSCQYLPSDWNCGKGIVSRKPRPKSAYDFLGLLWHYWLGDRHPASKKLGVGLLVVTIWLELCTSHSFSCHHSRPPSSLASTKSRIETFWYRLTQVHLENVQ